ncbi:MAG: hypothetical protein H0U59_13600 [Gemmatimonadaceae bacterium]|nr:hypothetical protein [Gemmatimonadaceae bacterium]
MKKRISLGTDPGTLVPSLGTIVNGNGVGALMSETTVLNDIGTPTFTRATSAYDPSSNTIVGAGVRRRRTSYLGGKNVVNDLIEPTRTNLLAAGTSERFDLWTNTNTTQAGGQTAPDGTATAWNISDTNAGAYQSIAQVVTVANDSLPHVVSIHVKKTTGGTSATFGMNVGLSGGTPVSVSPRVNTDTGTSGAGGNAATVVSAGDYWRIWVVITNNTTANTSLTIAVYPATNTYGIVNADSATGVGTATLSGAFLEKAAWPTSYISNRNLLLQSEVLSNASWTKDNATITDNTLADETGVVCLDSILEAATTTGHGVYQNPTAFTASTDYTIAATVKAIGRTWVELTAVKKDASAARAWFNISTGVVGTVGANASSSGITDLGNGLYRVRMAFNSGVGATTSQVFLSVRSADNSTATYLGDITKGVYAGKFQLEYDTTATTYWATTTAVGLRAADSLTVDLSSIVDTRRNLVTYSEQFDHANWGKTRATVSANAVTDPNGNTYADKLVEDATAASSHFLSQSYAGFTNGQAYTFVAYLKAAERSTVILQLPGSAFSGNRNVWFDLAGGVVSKSNGGALTSSITAASGGWYRCAVTATADTTAAGSIAIYLDSTPTGSSIYSGDGVSGANLFGAQLVAGTDPGASNYVATAATAQTANVTGLSNTAGTIIAIVRPYGWTGDQDGTTVYFPWRDSVGNTGSMSRASATLLNMTKYGAAGGAQAVSVTHGFTNGTATSQAMTWDASGVRGYVNGTLGATNAVAIAPYLPTPIIIIGADQISARQFSGEVLVLYIGRALSAADNLTMANSIPSTF